MRNAMLTVVTAVVLIGAPAWAQIVPVPAEQFTDLCPGDLNGDEVVNSADLAPILGSFGICEGCDEDLNHDGYVDETDVKILALRWGPCASDADVMEKYVRTSTEVRDGPEINTGDVAPDDMFSDQEQEIHKSLTRDYRLPAATPDGPEINTGDVAADDMFSDQEQESGKSLTREYRRSPAAASDQPEINTGDVATDDMFSDIKQATCEGDLDQNGQVDSTDLAMLLTNYGRCKGCEEDLNGDSVVDQEDLDILFDIWGECPKQKPKQVSRALAGTNGDEIEENLPSQNEPEEVEPQCPGDLDGNGTVDSADLAILLTRYGRCKGCEADLSGDGYVDQDDIDELMASWGDCPAEAFSDANSQGKSRPKSLTGG